MLHSWGRWVFPVGICAIWERTTVQGHLMHMDSWCALCPPTQQVQHPTPKRQLHWHSLQHPSFSLVLGWVFHSLGGPRVCALPGLAITKHISVIRCWCGKWAIDECLLTHKTLHEHVCLLYMPPCARGWLNEWHTGKRWMGWMRKAANSSPVPQSRFDNRWGLDRWCIQGKGTVHNSTWDFIFIQ